MNIDSASDKAEAGQGHGAPAKTPVPQSPAVHFFRLGPAVLGALLAVLLLLFKMLGISLRFQVLTLSGLYLSIGAQSVTYAVILTAIQFPRDLFVPNLKRLLRRPEVIVGGLALGFLFLKLLPLAFGISLLISVLVLFVVPPRKMREVLFPGLYLFVGLFTAFAYNVVAVTVRFTPDYDYVLQHADRFLLFGHSVSELSHRFAASVPLFVSESLLFWYALMFVQVGAVLMLCSTSVSRDYGMRFVSAILMAYLISVAIFFVFPTHSPYFTCVNHGSAHLPKAMLDIQEHFVQTATARFHGLRDPLGPEYYVSFPCMHISQPLIAMWFVRRWRRIFFVLSVVNAILAFAIVILEWHYLVDLLGGVVVATVALWLTERHNFSQRAPLVA